MKRTETILLGLFVLAVCSWAIYGASPVGRMSPNSIDTGATVPRVQKAETDSNTYRNSTSDPFYTSDANSQGLLGAISAKTAAAPGDSNTVAAIGALNAKLVGVQAQLNDANVQTIDAGIAYSTVQLARGTSGKKMLVSMPGAGKTAYVLGAILMADRDDSNAVVVSGLPDSNCVAYPLDANFAATLDANYYALGTVNVLPFYWANAGGAVLTPQTHARAAWFTAEANVAMIFRCNNGFCGGIKVGVK